MREIVLDTETTGTNHAGGDRIVEIGCVELINLVPTGKVYHQYLNPERPMPPEAQAVHGLSDDFLRDKPVFAEVVDAFLNFIGEAPLVIHNAAFDMGFLNAELQRLGFAALPAARATDTVLMARKKFPGQRNNLDALCERFQVDRSARKDFHGALLDAQLLAAVYLELKGGAQPTFDIAATASAVVMNVGAARQFRHPRPHAPTEAERDAHAEFLKKISHPLWLKETASDL
ncbi:MAG: DNA polymerase III subunit epsilon [Alphaproteobacteria bacterium]|nr:DNA polymerase III subunit epsilon [Alphaproteobacteria bacterium]NDC56454.1 DNA polymerase III subunit epsilon [Alphaproteobacteria bacterium]